MDALPGIAVSTLLRLRMTTMLLASLHMLSPPTPLPPPHLLPHSLCFYAIRFQITRLNQEIEIKATLYGSVGKFSTAVTWKLALFLFTSGPFADSGQYKLILRITFTAANLFSNSGSACFLGDKFKSKTQVQISFLTQHLKKTGLSKKIDNLKAPSLQDHDNYRTIFRACSH